MKIVWVRDLTTGYDSANPPTYMPSLPLSSGHMIQLRAESASHAESIMLTLRCALLTLGIFLPSERNSRLYLTQNQRD